MGNYRFKFSTIIPNSWFHSSTTGNKVRNKIIKTQPITTSSSSSSSSIPSTQPADYQRKSYYFTRDLTLPDPTTRVQDTSPPLTHQPDSPRKSTKKKRPTSPKKPIRQKSVSPETNPTARCSCGISPVSVSEESNLSDTEVINCSCKTNNSYDVEFGKVDLPPIITKPVKQDEFGSGKWVIDGESRGLSVQVVKQGISGSPGRNMKGNGYSPRLGNRVRVNGISARRRNGSRRSLSESLAVVKTSTDPGRDFKESMVEMIMENNIKSSKDLEDLLACYLSLNSDEYHDLIIKGIQANLV
ncbi:hypothetical protein L1987_83090 [Smallanthus sonchifolius]|uniref:Uncharacterized protein n=1 Tax=Smallanthus sonchifolius TaxID=185202 RepID=A0ACB8YAV7_9ASTR|nr:hypothetical protein L1987_83090 [Smallanthus sonchifolius]